MPSPVLRSTTEADRAAVLELVRDAFSHGGRDGQEEVEIVEQTWARTSPADCIEVVAADGDQLVGHVLGAAGDLDGTPLLAVAPLGVSPSHQGSGVGSALMVELLRRAEERGWPAVVLLGNPAYYGRFGFEPAGEIGVVYVPVGSDSPHFQLRRLSTYDRSLTGTFRYVWEQDP